MKKLHLRQLNFWFNTLFIGTAIIAVILFVRVWLPPILPINISIYWFDLHYYAFQAFFGLVIMPVLILLYLGWNVYKAFRKQAKEISGWIFVLAVTANIFACGAMLPGSVYVAKHHTNLHFEGRIYNVMEAYNTAGNGLKNSYAYLYECDRFGVFCTIAYTYIAKNEYANERTRKSWHVTLIPDPASHTVTLAINGEAVYVHLR